MSIPITLLTGFLGSGKTTFLNRLMQTPTMGDALVLVNEVGEVSVDHLLVRHVDERMVVLPSGCVCCALREDLVDSLSDEALLEGRSRVVIETTGLADPTPLVATIVQHPVLRARFHLDAVVVALDATRAAGVVESYPEAPKQLALADIVLITKSDLARESEIHEAEALARSAAPDATLLRATLDGTEGEVLFGTPSKHVGRPPVEGAHTHTHGIRTFFVESRTPVAYRQLALWISLMSQLNGARMLRLKGLVHVSDHDDPVVVQAVQHVVYPTYTLDAWPEGTPRTRLSGITQGMSDRQFEDTVASLRQTVSTAADEHRAPRRGRP
ncbi:MAG: GTP-binding protein [Sandaracinaceae bacterium]